MTRILVLKSVRFAREGTTAVVCNIINSLCDKNCVFDVVSINSNDDYKRFIESKGGSFFVANRSFGKLFQYIRTIRSIIKKQKYDAIHIHGNSHTLVLELLACRFSKVKNILVHAHSTSCKNRFVHWALSPLFFALCGIKIACGESAGRFMYGRRRFLIIKNGIDINRFTFSVENRSNIRNSFNINRETIVLGHVGSFSLVKNHAFLIDILSALSSSDQKYVLMLVGEGKLMETIKRKTIEKHLESNVIFCGSVDNVFDYLSSMDFLLMPSLFEGFPLSLVEAQANGLNCLVSSNVPHEVNLTGNISFLPIDQGESLWAKEIQKCSSYNRNTNSINAVNCIKREGFDIRTEALKLLEYYRSK